MTGRHGGEKTRAHSTPGPGAYAHALINTNGPKFGFGTALRPDLSHASKVPGPGTYMQANSMGQNNVTLKGHPKYSMKPRRIQMQHSGETPGPSLAYTQFG